MMNLENVKVQELSLEEQVNINGGIFFILFLKYGATAGKYLELSGFNNAGANK